MFSAFFAFVNKVVQLVTGNVTESNVTDNQIQANAALDEAIDEIEDALETSTPEKSNYSLDPESSDELDSEFSDEEEFLEKSEDHLDGIPVQSKAEQNHTVNLTQGPTARSPSQLFPGRNAEQDSQVDTPQSLEATQNSSTQDNLSTEIEGNNPKPSRSQPSSARRKSKRKRPQPAPLRSSLKPTPSPPSSPSPSFPLSEDGKVIIPPRTPLARYQENKPEYFVRALPLNTNPFENDSVSISQPIDPHDPKQRLTPSAEDLFVQSEESRLPTETPPTPINLPPAYVAPPKSIPSIPNSKRSNPRIPVGRLMKPKTRQARPSPMEHVLDPDQPTRNHQQEIANRMGSFLNQSHGPMSADNPRMPPRYHDPKGDLSSNTRDAVQGEFDTAPGGSHFIQIGGRRRKRSRQIELEKAIEPQSDSLVTPLLKTPPLRVENGDYLRIWGHYGIQEQFFNFGSLVRASKLTEVLPVWWDHLEWVDTIAKTELRKVHVGETAEEKAESSNFKNLLTEATPRVVTDAKLDKIRTTEERVSRDYTNTHMSHSYLNQSSDLQSNSIDPTHFDSNTPPVLAQSPQSFQAQLATTGLSPSQPKAKSKEKPKEKPKSKRRKRRQPQPSRNKDATTANLLIEPYVILSQQDFNAEQISFNELKNLYIGQTWAGIKIDKPTLILYPRIHLSTTWLARHVINVKLKTLFKMMDQRVKRKLIAPYILVSSEIEMLEILKENPNCIGFISRSHPILQEAGNLSYLDVVNS
jgi:hypothetical protein